MTDLNLELARRNMVEQQVRPWDVIDQRVLDLIGRAPREDYVPAAYRNLAFADLNLPIGHGQVMMAPKYEARILQELEIDPKDRILEIGTGSGYFTSLLAALGASVTSVEIVPELKAGAEKALAAHGVQNAAVEVGDGARGWDKLGPYDVIVLTGSTPVLPDAFARNLAPNGRLFAVVGRAPAMEARVLHRLGDDGIETRSLFETDLPALVNAFDPPKFTL
jgi:protein-L-isoaspartate(D-aspartate) O-methyltransferase